MTISRFFSLALLIVSILSLASCGKSDFLFLPAEPQKQISEEKVPVPSPTPSPSVCKCPPGYTVAADQSHCTRETTVPPLPSSSSIPIMPGDADGSYYSAMMVYTTTTGNSNWPFAVFTNDRNYANAVVDSSGVPLVCPAAPMSPYWRNRILSADTSQRISIKGPAYNVWFTKTFCIKIPNAKDYVIHVGADNSYQVKIDARTYAQCLGNYCFKNGVFLGQSLEAGKHLVELKYRDEGAYGAVWFEVFNNTIQEAQGAASDRDLNTVYSSKTLIGDTWDYEGEVCPEGYAYDVCETPRKCTKLEQAACL